MPPTMPPIGEGVHGYVPWGVLVVGGPWGGVCWGGLNIAPHAWILSRNVLLEENNKLVNNKQKQQTTYSSSTER